MGLELLAMNPPPRLPETTPAPPSTVGHRARRPPSAEAPPPMYEGLQALDHASAVEAAAATIAVAAKEAALTAYGMLHAAFTSATRDSAACATAALRSCPSPGVDWVHLRADIAQHCVVSLVRRFDQGKMTLGINIATAVSHKAVASFDAAGPARFSPQRVAEAAVTAALAAAKAEFTKMVNSSICGMIEDAKAIGRRSPNFGDAVALTAVEAVTKYLENTVANKLAETTEDMKIAVSIAVVATSDAQILVRHKVAACKKTTHTAYTLAKMPSPSAASAASAATSTSATPTAASAAASAASAAASAATSPTAASPPIASPTTASPPVASPPVASPPAVASPAAATPAAPGPAAAPVLLYRPVAPPIAVPIPRRWLQVADIRGSDSPSGQGSPSPKRRKP